MKRLALAAALAAAVTGGYAAAAGAQSTPPPLPPLNASQQAQVQQQLDLYRTEIDGRVTRGEITADEAGRLLRWREWQLSQQALGLAPPADAPSGPIAGDTAPPVTRYVAPPYYAPAAPYYAPAYPYPYYGYGPYYRPYYAPYWGWASICAGGWGHHGGARICI